MSTEPQDITDTKRLADRLVEIVSEQATHQLGLLALLHAFTAVAMSHPCCAQGAAIGARAAADLIETHAAPQDVRHIH